MTFRKFIIGATLPMALAAAGSAQAGEPFLYGNSVKSAPDQNLKNMTLTVTGPNGFHVKEFSKLSAPFVSLAENGDIADGLYYWQLTGSTNKQIKANPMNLNNGRGDREREFTFESASENGTFRVSGGVIVPLDSAIEDSSLNLDK